MVIMNGVFVDRYYFWIERFSTLLLSRAAARGKKPPQTGMCVGKSALAGAARERGRAEYTGCADLTPSAY